MAHHHIKRMHNRDEIEALMKGSACTLALQLCQASGNVPPSIGAKRDECAPRAGTSDHCIAQAAAVQIASISSDLGAHACCAPAGAEVCPVDVGRAARTLSVLRAGWCSGATARRACSSRSAACTPSSAPTSRTSSSASCPCALLFLFLFCFLIQAPFPASPRFLLVRAPCPAPFACLRLCAVPPITMQLALVAIGT